MSLYSELKRRNVIRVAVIYAVVSWLLYKLAGIVFPYLGIPDTGVSVLGIICAAGFLPALVLSWIFEITPDGVVRNVPIAQSSARPLDIFIIFLVMGSVAIVLADFFWLDTGNGEEASVTPGPVENVVAPQYPANSIAVLPFVNMSEDAANEYFSDGISEELLNLLARVPGLSVPSRSSSFLYKSQDFRIADVAGDLNVRYVLEGSVRKVGDRVRITAQLIDARTDTHLWSDTYDRTLDDIFAIQDEIAGAVVDQLKITLFGEAPRSEEIDAQAYALYLQARYLNSQGTAQAFASAIELYREALAIAPGYARAWRGLAVVYMNQANKGLRPEKESYALARQAIEQALAIKPDYAMAHATWGVLIMSHEGDMAQAAPHFAHALALDPDDLTLLSYASSLLLRLGRLDEAIAIREYDIVHDPLDPIGLNNLAFAYLKAERADEAIATVKTLLMLAPEYSGGRYSMGNALLLKGEYTAALQEMQQEPSEAWRLIGLAIVQWAAGNAGEAEDALLELIGRHGQNRAYYVALIYAFRGENDLAFEWLARAAQMRAASLTYIAVEPMFKNIHDDARWLPFLASIGMAPGQLQAIEFDLPTRD